MSLTDTRDGDEIFQFMATRWNITKARAIIAADPDRKRYSIEAKSWSAGLGLIAIDVDYAKTVDLDEPVIIATVATERGGKDDGPFLIDGHHRVYRAVQDDVEHLTAYLLTREETDSIQRDLMRSAR